jgi:diphthine synthase
VYVPSPDVRAVGVARLGQPTQLILSGTLDELKDVDFGGPLHSMVICGELHPLEEEMIEHFSVKAREGEVRRLPPTPPSGSDDDSDGEA